MCKRCSHVYDWEYFYLHRACIPLDIDRKWASNKQMNKLITDSNRALKTVNKKVDESDWDQWWDQVLATSVGF